MPSFTKRELTIAQIVGAALLAIGLIMGATGAFCLKHGHGLPEYIKGLRGSGWTLALMSSIWTSLATWRRLTS